MNNNETIINFAPTGAVSGKKENSYIPISVNEIVDDVLYACEIGITSVHLHVRDEKNGKATLSPELYGYVIEKLRKHAPSLVICVSLSGRYHKEIEERCSPLFLDKEIRPDMASLTLGSMNFLRSASVNTPETIITLAQKMIEQGIKPELEVFDSGMLRYAQSLIEKKLLLPPYYFNVILGNVATAGASLSDMAHLIQMLPQNSLVSFGGIGKNQLPVNATAIAMGYGVRVGLEDNLWEYNKNNKIPTNNAKLLQKTHDLLHIHKKEFMSSETFRKKLELEL